MIENNSDNYSKRVLKHYKIQNEVLYDLMIIAQRLCPDGEWVFQMFAYPDRQDNGEIKKSFMAVVTNGDDNVTAITDNPGASVAKLIFHLLSGSVFPLTGEGGRKFYPADRGWIRKLDNEDIGEIK